VSKRLERSNLKPGDVIEFPNAPHVGRPGRMVAIIRDGTDLRLEEVNSIYWVRLGAWRFDGQPWVINPRGNTTLDDNCRKVTGHEADVVHADMAAAILLGEVDDRTDH
jgi:hypothetical protein